MALSARRLGQRGAEAVVGKGADGTTQGHSLQQFPQIPFNKRKGIGEEGSGERAIKEVS